MTEIPGIVVPAAEDVELEEMVDELGSYEPLMTFPSGDTGDDEATWVGAFDAMIAAGLFKP